MGIILVASGGLTIAYVRTASAYVRAALRTLRILALIGAAAAIVIGLLLFFGLAQPQFFGLAQPQSFALLMWSAEPAAWALRIVTENPTWGHPRVRGELVRPGHPIAASTVRQILHDAGIDPAPPGCPNEWSLRAGSGGSRRLPASGLTRSGTAGHSLRGTFSGRDSTSEYESIFARPSTTVSDCRSEATCSDQTLFDRLRRNRCAWRAHGMQKVPQPVSSRRKCGARRHARR
jgi:hypothetical protein